MNPSEPIPLPPPPRARWVKWVLVTMLLAGGLVACIAVFLLKTVQHNLMPRGATLPDTIHAVATVGEAALTKDPAPIAFGDKNTINIMVLGVDYDYTDSDVPFSKNARSDTIFVLQLRRDGNYIGMLSMPRDMYVEFPDGSHDKVNATYSRGGVKLESAMLNKFLGIDFDHYAVIRINAAQQIIDRLGGLDVNVEKDMNYDDNWGHLHVHLKKGQQHLNGEQAIGFARFRHDEDGDRGRMRRQQVFIAAVMDKLKSMSTFTDTSLMGDVAKIAASSLETDMKANQMMALANLYHGFDKHNLRTAQLDGADTTIDQQAVILPPPEDKVAKVVRRVIKSTDGETAPTDVEVLNGSPYAGAARDVQKDLEAKGYHVIYVGPAPKPVDKSELIDYNLEDAQRKELLTDLAPSVSGTLAMLSPTEAGDQWQSNPNYTDVTIILGADYKAPGASPKPSSSAH